MHLITAQKVTGLNPVEVTIGKSTSLVSLIISFVPYLVNMLFRMFVYIYGNLKIMKKIFLFLLVSILMISCDTTVKIQTDMNDPMSGYMVGNDEKSNAMIQFTKAYQENNISNTKSIFADDVVFNVNDAKMTFDEVNEGFSLGHTYFDNIKHSDVHVATMYYNDGNVFTNYWYTWTATSKKNKTELTLRGYCWFKWEDDKVIEVYNAFDPTAYSVEMSN